MIKKRLILGLVVFLLVLSVFALAQEETGTGEGEKCSGIWGAVKCWLWGSGEKPAALRGKASGVTEVALAGKVVTDE